MLFWVLSRGLPADVQRAGSAASSFHTSFLKIHLGKQIIFKLIRGMAMTNSTKTWAENNFANATLGDKRLSRRAVQIAASIAAIRLNHTPS